MQKAKIQALTTAALVFALALTGYAQTSSPEKSNTASQTNITALPQSRSKLGGNDPSQRIAREVLHELLLEPYYTVFDNLAFQVQGNRVILLGQVVNPTVKSDAESAMKHIEGVEEVVNKIEVLPPFSSDERIRRQEYRAIFGYDGLSRYGWAAAPAIHIVVKSGRVTLVGVVDSQSDKDVAGIRANSVPGVFSVDNQLQVANSGKKTAKR